MKIAALRRVKVREKERNPHALLCIPHAHEFVKQIDPNFENDDGLEIGMTIDGIHCEMTEPRPFSTSHASHKKGGEPCLDCELGVLTHKDKLAWINGPFPSATHDRAVFRVCTLP